MIQSLRSIKYSLNVKFLRVKYAYRIAKMVYLKNSINTILNELEIDYPIASTLFMYSRLHEYSRDVETTFTNDPQEVRVIFRMIGE